VHVDNARFSTAFPVPGAMLSQPKRSFLKNGVSRACHDPIETFTGGIFDTNCFFLPEHGILIDAPQDSAAWLAGRNKRSSYCC
jgi:hypothetical protein